MTLPKQVHAAEQLPTQPLKLQLEVMNQPYLRPPISTPTPNPTPQMQSLSDQTKYKAMTLEQRIRNYLGSNTNNVGVTYRDLNSGETIEINGYKVFTAASTVKVAIALAIADKLETGELSPDTLVYYSSADYEGGTGIMQGQDKSKPYKVINLVEYMIRYSDNIATNMLLGVYGYENFKNYLDQITEIPTNHYANQLTALGATNALEKLYNGAQSKYYYSTILEYLRTTQFHDRLDRHLSYDRVAHKIGNYGGNTHDVGVFLIDDNPYIVSVYTNGVPNANTVITGISDIIYDRQTGQKW